MDEGVRSSSTVRRHHGRWGRLVHWFLLHGDRRIVAGSIVAAVVVGMAALISFGIIDVGPGGSAATLFGSGLTSGVVTLVTIALSINQLILSRVFGSPGDLTDRLQGTRDLRRSVEVIAGQPSSPNDPAAFLSMIATTLRDQATDLQSAIEASRWDPSDEVTRVLRDVVEYGRRIDDRLEGQTEIVDVRDVVLGPAYALNMTAVSHLRREHADVLPATVEEEFRALDELFEAVAVARQFFKTLALQQDFAHLSRLIVYTGLVALLVTISLTLVYRTNGVTIPAATLPVAVSLGMGVIVAPLAAFVAFVLRAATIAHRTVSVGPFVPP